MRWGFGSVEEDDKSWNGDNKNLTLLRPFKLKRKKKKGNSSVTWLVSPYAEGLLGSGYYLFTISIEKF